MGSAYSGDKDDNDMSNYLISCGGKSIQFINLNSPKTSPRTFHNLHDNVITSLAQTSRNHFISSSNDQKINVYRFPSFLTNPSKIGISEGGGSASEMIVREIEMFQKIGKLVSLNASNLIASSNDEDKIFSCNIEEGEVNFCFKKEYKNRSGNNVKVNDLMKISNESFVSASDGLYLWDVEKRNLVKNLSGEGGNMENEPLSLDYSIESDILFYSENFSCSTYSFEKGKKIKELKHEERITSVKYLREKKYIITGDEKGRIYFWDLRKPEKEMSSIREHVDRITKIEELPMNKLATASMDMKIQFWDVDKGKSYDSVKHPDGVLDIIRIRS